MNRPFNDQSQERIRLETDAVETILECFITGQWKWIVSDVLKREVNKNPYKTQRDRMVSLINTGNQYVLIGENERLRGKELEAIGFKHFDSLHLACAESAHADIFLTTDDRLIRRANRFLSKLRVRALNPIQWLQEIDHNEY